MTWTGDHGIVLRTYGSPEETQGLDPEQMLGLEPFWLTDSDFYFRDGVPDDGPPRKSDWVSWARARGGEGAGWRHVLLRVQATQDRTVLVLLPKVNVLRTSVDGGLVLGPEKEPGGNGLLCRQFELDLDADAPTARYLPDRAGETPQFTMSKGDSEAFLLIAHATEGRFEWTVDLRCLVDGEEVSLRADDGGRPFITVGYHGVDRRWWSFSERQWVQAKW